MFTNIRYRTFQNCVRKEYKKIFTINKKKSRNVNDKKDELKKTEEETL
jgi:hypothetical protein